MTLLVIGVWCLASSALALNLSDLDGSNGFQINGIDSGDFSGHSVSGAGDVNGDGIDDVIIGAPMVDPNRTGQSYVVFGSSAEFPVSIDLTSLDGSNGFQINGINEDDLSGASVSGAGDVNGDSIDDLIIGAPYAAFYTGESYVVFGSTGGFPATLDLNSLNGRNGFQINGSDSFGYSGAEVSGAGDVNGDGIDDVIIGAFRAGQDDTGESYVVFGSSGQFRASLDLASLDGRNGFQINGIDTGDSSGLSVSGVGDINGDGIDDVIIGAYMSDPNGQDEAGESYVVFGSSTGFPASLDLISLNGSNGFQINGIDADDWSGRSVSGAGDINDDGINDLIIGAYGASPNGQYDAGESYVIFGSSAGFPTIFDLTSLDGSNGFQINGIDAYDWSGNSVSEAGDINGDGIDDLVIGAISADPYDLTVAGESYVVFGSSVGFPVSLELSSLDGSNGIHINGIDAGDYCGASVSGAGDVNGDGGDDLIIGAFYAAPNDLFAAGESYVVFGHPSSSTKDELEELIDEVEEIDPALAESLEEALERITDENTNNDTGACGQLKIFVSKVNAAERSGDLTKEEAEELREAAEEISTDLDCS